MNKLDEKISSGRCGCPGSTLFLPEGNVYTLPSCFKCYCYNMNWLTAEIVRTDFQTEVYIKIQSHNIQNKSNYKIKFDLYLSKKSATVAEIKGNITNLIPLDDSFNLEFNLAVKDSVGGWKDNAHLYKSKTACSSLKMFFGNAWTPIMENLEIYNATCPLPVGFYKLNELDSELLKISNFPKTFFYGTYRFRFSYTKNNEVYGCYIIVMEVKRPRETNN